MTGIAEPLAADLQPRKPAPVRLPWEWLGVAPFFIFALIFLIIPSANLFVGTFLDAQGRLTLANIFGLAEPSIVSSYKLSIAVSAVTAVGGGIFGFLLAYAVTLGGLPRWVRSA